MASLFHITRGVAAALVLACFTATAAAQDANSVRPDHGGYVLAAVLAMLVVAAVVLLIRVRQSIRAMGTQHEQLLQSLITRSNELEATLSSMVEGVLAVDMQKRLISMNEAAAGLLDLRLDRVTGKDYRVVIDSESLRHVIDATLESDEPIQADVELALGNGLRNVQPTRRLFQAQGATLRDHNGRRIGSLITLHDVTRLRRLEVVRRDFVTNASHEIKTPVSAIKAAAETIIDTDGDDPEATQHFIAVIARQADRLQNIVEDLLSLARIEQDTGAGRVPREPGRIRPVLEAAAETCSARAQAKNMDVVLTCPSDLMAPINASLLEQAVVNLLENAIKYSPGGRIVEASAEVNGHEIVLAVNDEGPGIAAEHLPRIFERFYRTDKARSRELGGTGLGLAIVKHIAIAHGGRVSVDSTPGEGSTFRIHLPLAD